MGFWSDFGSWIGDNLVGIGQGISNVLLTNRQLAESELNNQFNRDLASKNYDETIKNNEFNRNLASENMQEQLRNNEFNRNMASEKMAFEKEQYENGVINQAEQYRSLGINPSAIGGQLANMPSMSSNQASTGSFGGANTNSSSAQALTNASNLQYNLGLSSSLLSIKKQKAEIDNINADTDSKNATVDKIHSETDYNRLLSSYQDMLNSDKSHTVDMLKKIGLTEGLIRDLQNVDWQTALALGVVKLVDIATDVSSYNTDSIDSNSDWVNSLRENWYSLKTCNKDVKSAISDFGKNIGFDSELTSDDWYKLSSFTSYNDAYSYLSNLYNPVKTTSHKSSQGYIHGGKGGSF